MIYLFTFIYLFLGLGMTLVLTRYADVPLKESWTALILWPIILLAFPFISLVTKSKYDKYK